MLSGSRLRKAPMRLSSRYAVARERSLERPDHPEDSVDPSPDHLLSHPWSPSTNPQISSATISRPLKRAGLVNNMRDRHGHVKDIVCSSFDLVKQQSRTSISFPLDDANYDSFEVGSSEQEPLNTPAGCVIPPDDRGMDWEIETTLRGRSEEGSPTPIGASNLLLDDSADVVLVWPADDPKASSLTRGDLARLNEGKWLNDTLIEFGLRRILSTIRIRNPSLADSIYIFSSFFYTKLSQKAAPSVHESPSHARPSAVTSQDFASIQRWTRATDLFSLEYIVVPINEGFHWYLAVIVNPGAIIREYAAPLSNVGSARAVAMVEDVNMYNSTKPSAFVASVAQQHDSRCYIFTFDSLGKSHEPVIASLRNYLKEEAINKKHITHPIVDSLVGITVKVPLQPNQVDCGLYLLHYAEQFFLNDFGGPEPMIPYILAESEALGERDNEIIDTWNPEAALVKRETMRNEVKTESIKWFASREALQKIENAGATAEMIGKENGRTAVIDAGPTRGISAPLRDVCQGFPAGMGEVKLKPAGGRILDVVMEGDIERGSESDAMEVDLVGDCEDSRPSEWRSEKSTSFDIIRSADNPPVFSPAPTTAPKTAHKLLSSPPSSSTLHASRNASRSAVDLDNPHSPLKVLSSSTPQSPADDLTRLLQRFSHAVPTTHRSDTQIPHETPLPLALSLSTIIKMNASHHDVPLRRARTSAPSPTHLSPPTASSSAPSNDNPLPAELSLSSILKKSARSRGESTSRLGKSPKASTQNTKAGAIHSRIACETSKDAKSVSTTSQGRDAVVGEPTAPDAGSSRLSKSVISLNIRGSSIPRSQPTATLLSIKGRSI